MSSKKHDLRRPLGSAHAGVAQRLILRLAGFLLCVVPNCCTQHAMLCSRDSRLFAHHMDMGYMAV